MKNKIRFLLRVIFVLIFICSIYLIYNWNYSYFSSVPSEKWAKELTIAEGSKIDKIKITKYGINSVVAYTENENVKINLVDKTGKKIKDIVIKTEDDFILDMNVFTDGKNIYATWIKSKSGEKYMETHILNENLSDLKKTIDRGVQFCTAVDSENIILGYKDKIEVKNIKDNEIKDISLISTMANGIKTKDGYIIVSLNEGQVDYIEIKNEQVIIKNRIAKFTTNGSNAISDMAVNSDGKNVYTLFEHSSKGDFGGMYKLIYDLQTGKSDLNSFEIDGNQKFYNPVAIQSDNAVKFLVVGEKKSRVEEQTESEILDVTFKDNKLNNVMKVTRMLGFSECPAISKDVVAFRNINGAKNSLCVTSSSDDFKKVNNVDRAEEKSLSKQYTISKSLMAIVNGIFVGVKWLGVGVFLIAIMAFTLVDKTKDKIKKPAYIISYAIAALVKIISIYNVVYTNNNSNIPPILVNSTLGIGILTSISILCVFFAYIKYSDDLEQLPFISFMEALIIDTVLTSILFIPYI